MGRSLHNAITACGHTVPNTETTTATRSSFHPRSPIRPAMAEDLPECCKCSYCFDLLVEPTTLNCGHSMCRHCRARWCLESGKKECPECVQVFLDISLRYGVYSLFLNNTMVLNSRTTVIYTKDRILCVRIDEGYPETPTFVNVRCDL